MYTLIICSGFVYGVCEKVERIEYPTQEVCRADLDRQVAVRQDVIFSVCAAKKA